MYDDAVDARVVFEGAQWIWSRYRTSDLVNSYLQARREFDVAEPPRKSTVKVTADSYYKLYVNGRFVCRGPARGFQEHWPYDEVDIAPFLKRGKNAIAVLAFNVGRGTYKYISAGMGGIILKGRVGRVDISTSDKWLVRRAPGFARNTAPVSKQQGYQEVFDARRDDDSWMLPSYALAAEETAAAVTEKDIYTLERFDVKWRPPLTSAAGSMPWHAVEPRGIPLQESEIIPGAKVVLECSGRVTASLGETDNNLTALYLAEKRKFDAFSGKAKRSKAGIAFHVPASPGGRFRSYVVDFGRESVGSIVIEATGAAGGEIVDSQVTETLTGGTPDVVSPYVDCRTAFGNRLILRKGTTRHEQFDHWGFRYLVLTVRENARPIELKVALRSALYPLEVRASFESSDRRLDDIYRISVRAQQCCMTDAYIDCPWREQAQWWGDARVQAANTFHLSADSRMFRRGIRSIAGQEVPNGLTYGMTPTIAHHCILPDYTFTWIMTLWDYHVQTGDRELARAYAERAWRALGYFREMTAANDLLPYDERYWLFLDWADTFRDGYPTLYNLLYFEMLGYAGKIFRLAGRRNYAADCAKRAEAVRKAILNLLYDEKRGVIYGGLDCKGRVARVEDPHSYAIAILAGLLPKKSRRFAREKLLPLVLGDNPKITGNASGLPYRPMATPSPFFMHYIFEALKKHGYLAEVVDCIRRWYGVFLDWDFTATGENWTHVTAHTSACHAWSAHPIVHLSSIVLGVTQTSVAWKSIRFAPVFETLSSARGKVATPRGNVEVDWKIEGSTTKVALSLPRGMKAAVRLPGVKRTVTGGRHQWTVK